MVSKQFRVVITTNQNLRIIIAAPKVKCMPVYSHKSGNLRRIHTTFNLTELEVLHYIIKLSNSKDAIKFRLMALQLLTLLSILIRWEMSVTHLPFRIQFPIVLKRSAVMCLNSLLGHPGALIHQTSV